MRLLHLSFLSFVFIASSALALGRNPSLPESQVKGETNLPLLPVLTKASSFPVISAQGALATDLDSGVTLYEKNPDTRYLPASTTKILTALVAMDYYSPESVLTVKKTGVDGQKIGLLVNERIKVNDLLHGLLMFSANDAAEVLAENFPGGRDTFVTAMNLKARELHLESSNFKNPTGLDGDGQYSTARDLIWVATNAMQNPYFAKIVKTKEAEVKSLDGRITHKLVNLNELVGEVEGVLGVKTGWTEEARENLVTYIERDGRRVMIALLASQDRFGETKELIGWIFENYKWEEVNFPYSSP